MSKNKILIAATIALFGVAGVVVANANQKPPPPDTAKLKESILNPVAQQESPGASGNASNQAADVSGAKEPVKKFILAVANPGKPPTAADKQASQQYLASGLKKRVASEFGGDPAKLLGLSSRSPFQAGEPSASGKGAQVSVTFPTGQGGKPKTILFQLQREGENWLIESVGAGDSNRR